MKVIIPLAGKGTRLLPLTRHVPKPLVRVAGRPVMDYVMDTLDGLDVEELIIITGHLKEQVERYVRTHYRQPARFIKVKRGYDDLGRYGLAQLRRPFKLINGIPHQGFQLYCLFFAPLYRRDNWLDFSP